jgi:hypothetical protein
MSPVGPITRRALPLLAALAVTLPLAGTEPLRDKSSSEEAPPKDKFGKAAAEASTFEVHFTDNGHIKVRLRDEKIELVTPYGKLLIPGGDVRRIDFATRVRDEVKKKIKSAIADLGKDDFKTREAASADLLALGPAAFPALLEEAKNPDAEVRRRVEELLTKIREEVPEDRLEVKPYDVVVTEHSRIAGHISSAALKVTTAQFGDQQMRLSDLRSLNAPGAEPEAAVATAAEPPPGNLMQLQGNIGKTYRFRVTGNPNGAVWGTDVYTSDSSLEAAAVHAGVLRPGQTGVVRVTIVAPPPVFGGSTRNGVTSMPFNGFPGAYKILK